MKEDEFLNRRSESTRVRDMRVLGNLICNWRPRYILSYTPRYVFNRVKLLFYELRHRDYPWLTPQANSLLSTLLKPTDIGLEWGSGRSTLWFAQRIKHLTSVEHDEAWHEAVSSKLKASNISNVTYLLSNVTEECEKLEQSSYVQVVNMFGKNSLDLALVDGIYRDVCANTVLEKIRPGGIVVLDNANWYLPSNSISPGSRPKNSSPISEAWAVFLNRVRNWRLIWTSSGITDTAIWFKPPGENNEKI